MVRRQKRAPIRRRNTGRETVTKLASLIAVIVCFVCPTAWAGGAASGNSQPGAMRNDLGPAVSIGRGRARTIVETDAAGRPTALGVEFTAGALSGLPRKPNRKDEQLDWHFPRNRRLRASITS
jgi:hypothetical protein